MPRTSLGLKTLRARPKRKDIVGSIDDVDGHHLLRHFGSYLNELRRDPLTDEKSGLYLRVSDVIARGRAVTVVARSGYSGEPGVTYDVVSHRVTHEKTAGEAATGEVRMTLWAPPGAKHVAVAIEYRVGAAHAGPIIDAFRRRMLDEHENFFFPYETVFEKDAWSASGDLKEVSVVEHRRSLDLSAGIDGDRSRETVRGSVVHTALPPKGQETWPKRVWDALRNGQVEASSFIGLRRDDALNPDDEVFVTVRRDGREKKFALGTDGVPSIRIVLTETGQPALDLDAFHRQVDENVRAFYKDQDMSWSRAWLSSAAAAEWIAV